VIPVLFGLCLFYMACGDLGKAQDEGERLLQLAQQAGDISYEIGVQFPLGVVSFLQADLEGARSHWEQCAALYDPKRDRDLARQQGQDPAVLALLFLSWTLWIQGYPEQARASAERGLQLAEEIDHPYTKAEAVLLSADFYHLLSEWPQCLMQAELGLELADQWRFPFSRAGCTMHRGVAIARLGKLESGIGILRQGLDAWKATRTGMALAYWHTELAQLYLLAGKREEGLAALDESLGYEEEVYWLPEQNRVRAELLLLAPGNDEQAESLLRQSLDLAKSEGARSLGLRSAMSMARLLQRLKRVDEARELLAECYTSFTEGFDTPDLREARELLDQLGTSVERPSAASQDHGRGTGEALLLHLAHSSFQSPRLAEG
jgi:adenylate cyclase